MSTNDDQFNQQTEATIAAIDKAITSLGVVKQIIQQARWSHHDAAVVELAAIDLLGTYCEINNQQKALGQKYPRSQF